MTEAPLILEECCRPPLPPPPPSHPPFSRSSPRFQASQTTFPAHSSRRSPFLHLGGVSVLARLPPPPWPCLALIVDNKRIAFSIRISNSVSPTPPPRWPCGSPGRRPPDPLPAHRDRPRWPLHLPPRPLCPHSVLNHYHRL